MAIARPSPDVPPITTATLPVRSSEFSIVLYSGYANPNISGSATCVKLERLKGSFSGPESDYVRTAKGNFSFPVAVPRAQGVRIVCESNKTGFGRCFDTA